MVRPYLGSVHIFTTAVLANIPTAKRQFRQCRGILAPDGMDDRLCDGIDIIPGKYGLPWAITVILAIGCAY